MARIRAKDLASYFELGNVALDLDEARQLIVRMKDQMLEVILTDTVTPRYRATIADAVKFLRDEDV